MAIKIIDAKEALGEDGSSVFLRNSSQGYEEKEKYVAAIVNDVKERGDKALFEYESKFDGVSLNPTNIRVTEDEIKKAYEAVDDELIAIMRRSLENIRSYHQKQLRQSFFTEPKEGVILGQRITPMEKVGVYVPGGKAAYPSSVLMNIAPAKVAGVERIIMCSPPDKEGNIYPVTLVAACEAGADEIYKAGGAQAIAAMAYGTDSVPKVDKIAGPGNVYVALAKRMVYGQVSIDSVAGPSEICVMADETADASFVAADLLSQAEHDEMASAVLVTTSHTLAEDVSKMTDKYMERLERAPIMQESLKNHGAAVICKNMAEAARVVNAIAPEHLEIVTANPFEDMTRIKNAGAIFLGAYSSEPLGDYYAGPDHVLPTNGTAKFFSPLSVDDFIKKSSIISYSKEALFEAKDDIISFANAEGLTAHANSIKVRFEKE